MIRILFLAANPTTTHLRLDHEVRAIETQLRSSRVRDSFDLRSLWSATPEDVLEGLNAHRPHVVHFSGHGDADGTVLLADGDDGVIHAPVLAMTAALAHARTPARLLVLNACHSSRHAADLCRHVPAVVGMQDAVSDDAARVFSGALYRAIGFGCSVAEAFEQGCAAVRMRAFDEHEVPALHHDDDVDVDALVLAPRGDDDLQLDEFMTSLADTAEAAVRELATLDAPQGPRLLARFRELHAQHLDSLRRRQFTRAHQVLKRVFMLQTEIARQSGGRIQLALTPDAVEDGPAALGRYVRAGLDMSGDPPARGLLVDAGDER